MSIKIVFPSDFRVENFSKIHKLFAEESFSDQSSMRGKEIVLDLRFVSRFTPFSGCYLASVIQDFLDCGVSNIRLMQPAKDSARHQIEHLGIVSHFVGGKTKVTKRVRTVPLVHIRDHDHDLAARLGGLVRDSLKLTTAHYYLIHLCLKELLQNAYEHGHSEKGTIACAYGIGNRKVVRICTLDHGIGILAHLIRNPQNAHIKSHRDALMSAIRKGITGETKRSRGLGLYYVTSLLGTAGGNLSITSGDTTMDVGLKTTTRFTALDTIYNGTIVNITFVARPEYRFTLDDLED